MPAFDQNTTSQSDHIGIETVGIEKQEQQAAASQSDHIGIET